MNFLSHLVAPLNRTLFAFGEDQVTTAEILGFLTGIWCVWLTVRARVSNFPVGLANDAFFFILFLAARLYADAALQIVYFGLGAMGWCAWVHADGRVIRPTSRAGRGELLWLLAFVIVATAFLTWLLSRVHDVAPFLDALTTALSLAAQWLLNFKKVQNWYFWIAADCIYIPLYVTKHLWLTSIVYVVFLALCFRGLVAWRRDLEREEGSVPALQATM